MALVAAVVGTLAVVACVVGALLLRRGAERAQVTLSPMPVQASLGAVVRVGAFQYRVDGVRRVQSVGSGFGTRTAPAGTVFVLANVTVMNVSDRVRFFSPRARLQFGAANGALFGYDLLSTSRYNATLGTTGSSALSPGTVRSVGVVFNVPMVGSETGRLLLRAEPNEDPPAQGTVELGALPYSFQ